MASSVGITGYGAYVPYWRLTRAAVAAALGTGGGKGTRAVASYDEDTTTLGVEAARVALRGQADEPGTLYFSTTDPAYADKSNATVVHAALRLGRDVLAVDFGGAVRSGIGALLAAAGAAAGGAAGLVVLADTRTGLPGGQDETAGGDAASALLLGRDTPGAPVLAELLAQASATAEFLDRWRVPGASASRVWEERFGEQAYLPLAHEAFAAALKDADLTPDQLDRVIVAGTHARAVRAFAARCGARRDALAPDLTDALGNPGTAQAGLLLADALDRAEPGQTIALVVLADGATATVWRATDALPAGRPAVGVADQVAAGNDTLPYASFLTWKGFLDREPPRRPDPAAPAAPPSLRSAAWKFGFVASKCTACGDVQLPPGRVCKKCAAVDEATPVALADTPAKIATFTVDRLAYTPSPPLVGVVVDFDGGGRTDCELTDSAGDVAIGQRVEMTFRRVVTAGNGIHNYFWKARPVRFTKER
ncbi:OB-fold domain-containing protein [Pseudofrankia sp. BMG5.37]|uniref:OB-fold domain-containing protein n=1 Tax=Pseudofrankia sp. BMG5.37 TaxID=3050035 RepID=UPI0028948B77|nr:OB-fold domain-containing protein [Pseudofrankia sp. BMG5.37]MDT3441951.1 OB-fold domain-containing protein [Pseudofrankia sp. BMG5.37]